MAHCREYSGRGTVVRLFNIVGPRQSSQYGMVLPRFVRQALECKPLTVYRSGEQTRCFAHVGDVVEALTQLFLCDAATGEIINVGSAREISINALAEMVLSITGSPSRVEYLNAEEVYGSDFEESDRRVPCLQKLERLTGFRPATPIESVIRMIVDHERTNSPVPEMAAVAGV